MKRPELAAGSARHTRRDVVLGCLALTALVAAVFGQSLGHAFVNIDDGLYVTENDVVSGGLSWGSVVWAFTTFHAANWHPLTWLSLLLDVSLFGNGAFGHHLTNVLLHLVATLGLFAVLLRATAAPVRSGIVAALFAIHPLHVESVAWISERKDVLSLALAVMVLAAYQRYANRPAAGRYFLVAVTFALGLLAKPMLVTLPVILLAWDFWPLARIDSVAALRARLVEKLPLFALSAVASVVTLRAQSGSAVVALEHLALGDRLAHAVHSAGWYLLKTVWPSGLAAFYPYDVALPAWQVVLAAVVLLAITVGVALRRTGPLVVGWSWYLVTLLPVIGIVQVGAQARADRYTYLPLVGIFLMVAFSVESVLGRAAWVRGPLARVPAAAAVILVLVFAAVAHAQVGYWRDARTLMERAVAVTERNWFAHNALGRILTREGNYAEAERHLREALRLAPSHPDVQYNAGVLHAELQRWPESAASLRAALALRPSWPEAHYNLGRALHAQGVLDEAAVQYAAALALQPGYVDALNNLGAVRLAAGDLNAAESALREAARLDPASPFPHLNLAVVHLYRGAIGPAERELEVARALGATVPESIERAFRERAGR